MGGVGRDFFKKMTVICRQNFRLLPKRLFCLCESFVLDCIVAKARCLAASGTYAKKNV